MRFTKFAFCFFILFVASHSFLHAQMKQGSILLGGDISFSSQKVSGVGFEPKNNYFSFSPAIAVAVKDNFFAGIRLIYQHSRNDSYSNSDLTTTKRNEYGGQFFLRHYKPLGSRFYFFVEENIGATAGKSTVSFQISPGTTTTNFFNAQLGIYPGVACALTPHFQLETGLQNLFSVYYFHDGPGANNIGAGTAFSQVFNNLYLGARFLL